MSARRYTDERALDAIRVLLDSTTWDNDTLMGAVAEVVRMTGREIRDVGEGALRAYQVVTANGMRVWDAEDEAHAREQHDNGFGGQDGEEIESVSLVGREQDAQAARTLRAELMSALMDLFMSVRVGEDFDIDGTRMLELPAGKVEQTADRIEALWRDARD